MPEFEKVSDEALMLWIVNALAEAHRRGLTNVTVNESRAKPLERAEAASAACNASRMLIH